MHPFVRSFSPRTAPQFRGRTSAAALPAEAAVLHAPQDGAGAPSCSVHSGLSGRSVVPVGPAILIVPDIRLFRLFRSFRPLLSSSLPGLSRRSGGFVFTRPRPQPLSVTGESAPGPLRFTASGPELFNRTTLPAPSCGAQETKIPGSRSTGYFVRMRPWSFFRQDARTGQDLLQHPPRIFGYRPHLSKRLPPAAARKARNASSARLLRRRPRPARFGSDATPSSRRKPTSRRPSPTYSLRQTKPE